MPIDQGQYIHAMEEDVFTGKPMPKNAVQVVGSDVQLPVDIQSRYATTIQTHNAVSVGASSSSQTSFIDCNGFTEIALTLTNDAAVAGYLYLNWSHDGVNSHGNETSIASGTSSRKAVSVPTKARYVQVGVVNSDTVGHIISVWEYLKA